MSTLALFNTKTTFVNPVSGVVGAARCLLPILSRGKALDRRAVEQAMSLSFGGSDANGAWDWKSAYDAVEIAQVLHARRLAPQLARLEDAPGATLKLLEAITQAGPTHTRRNDEQVALDQFSTPLEIAALAVLAGQVRAGDVVLEPSAGNGMLAVLAEACGAKLHLNELADRRCGHLKAVFTGHTITQLNGLHLADTVATSGTFDCVLMNPPFTGLHDHVVAALRAVADQGRIAAIVPATYFASKDLDLLSRTHQVRGRILLPTNAFYKHGTTVDTGLLVVDRLASDGSLPAVVPCETLDDAIAAVEALVDRAKAKPRAFRVVAGSSQLVRPLGSVASNRLKLLSSIAALDYAVKPWAGTSIDIGMFSKYVPSRVALPSPRPHPAELVESSAMATTALPEPSYVPALPQSVIDSQISEAQLEAVIYAGQAHSTMLPAHWRMSTPTTFEACAADAEGAFQCRQGFFIGDGTGVGKGTEVAAIVAENMANGRTKAVWFSKNNLLIEDARRDWNSVGGQPADIFDQCDTRLGGAIRADKGILFSTYGTLRQPARGDKASRLDQIVAWCGGPDFEGLIVFDEAHEMGNAAGGKSNRGVVKPSQQGMLGLLLQYRLPKARVLYVSATGAATAANLSYAARLGLWGCTEAPFLTRDHFLKAADEGGTAMLELIARELKARGLFLARSLSFEGVVVDPLLHELTETDIMIWDTWADAFQQIHQNLELALQAVNVRSAEGETNSSHHLAVAKSAFASTSQRFFNALLCGLKAPTVIRAMRQDLAAGRCCTVQLVSTNEASLDRRLDALSPDDFDDLAIDLTPRDTVTEYLENSFPMMLMTEVEDDDGNVRMEPVRDANGNAVVSQEALRLRDESLMTLAMLPAVDGILDAIIHAFGVDAVAEVTGRRRRVIVDGDRKRVQKISSNARSAETEAFNNGDKDILVFSQAGGTGRSLHADRTFKNQRQRVSYCVEWGWRAITAIQGLGRTHRSNQVSAPIFRPVSTNIKGELRFLSTIARLLDTLGAITRGDRRSAGSGMLRAEDNLENEWGRRALLAFYYALIAGDITCMSVEDFETKTALKLRSDEGAAVAPESMPPLHTFLNRLLALKISDQNALFGEFQTRFTAIIDTARSKGTLETGVEDIVAEDMDHVSTRTIRTDPTGGLTELHHFSIRSRRKLLDLDAAKALMRDEGPGRCSMAWNSKSKRVALVVHGQTTTDNQDRLWPAVRLVRPNGERDTVVLKLYEESNWEEVDAPTWEAAWADAHANLDPFVHRDLYMVTGIILPIWKHMPRKFIQVRRLRAPSGQRWLGVTLDDVMATSLLKNLGQTMATNLPRTAAEVEPVLIKQNRILRLAQQLRLRRSKVMDRYRIEVDGNPLERSALLTLGCFAEIINHTGRVFVPVDRPDVLDAVLRRYPTQEVVL